MGKKKSFIAAGCLAAFGFGATAVSAQDATGEVSLWLQGNVPSFTLDDGSACDAGGTEFCAFTGGVGGYAAAEVGLANGWTLLGDLTLDFHIESDTGTRDEHALYGGVGIHMIDTSAPTTWGMFGVLGFGDAASDNDSAPLFLGLGAEALLNDVWVQGGGLLSVSDQGDGIENLLFVRAGKDFALANGSLSTSAALGIGDFEEGSGVDRGQWVQLSVRYDAPLTDNINWFTAYQGDLVNVVNNDRTLMHTVQLGISIPLGGGTTTPFSTPNFRAPITYAGEFN
ncbi:hypothetical protein [Aliiroseovarius subalbicans]|uniref:hypothetical protein n=1 Tax=Aliiroseovarius subalbicans TaxID=2925840 RepID=UPI001F5707A6|nr:hypothetical protein [Aliiroseovarius subalbicans]MCI2400299.1 hypothetical protein [Aliiroseovarius subalbicans]